MDTTTDVNSLLANIVYVFANQERLAREASEKALEGFDEPINKADPHYAKRMRAESARLSDLAGCWKARADVARSGYLLISEDEVQDAEFMRTYDSLIKTCQNAGRVVYAREVDAGVNEATSPKPGGPIRPDVSALPGRPVGPGDRPAGEPLP